MRRDPATGILLIIGALGMLLVAGLHPTGHSIASAEDLADAMRLNAIVHGAAIAAIAGLLAAAAGFTRSLDDGPWSTLGLAFFVVSGLAAMCAAITSGFVSPEIIARIRAGGDTSMLELLGWYSWRVNQGFARVHIAGSAAAIVFWSVTLVRRQRAVRACGIFGMLTGLAVLAPLFGGHLHLDVHGFGAVMLAQSAWLIWVGVLLLRRGSPSLHATSA